MIIQRSNMADDDVDVEDALDDIANALIVTNLSSNFFEDESLKNDFEAAFRAFDSGATFNYLKSFRRARVNFSTTEGTVAARIKFHEEELCGQQIKCYFAQIPKTTSKDHLLPPKPEKMFLISPPSSPPVGWEQVPESEPVLNFELIDALSRLSPGETHEVHPPSDTLPAIIVHLCEDPDGFADRPTIMQTRCPERH